MVQNYVQKKAREQATWSLLLLLLFPVNLEGVSWPGVSLLSFAHSIELEKEYLITRGNRP